MGLSLSGSVITQTGTNNNLSSFAAISGVTVTAIQGIDYYVIPDNRRLVINGDFVHADMTEVLIMDFDPTNSGTYDDGSNNAAIEVNGNFSLGSETVVNSVDYRPEGLLLRFTGSGDLGHARAGGLRVNSGGVFNWYSGLLETTKGIGTQRDGGIIIIHGKECVFKDNVPTPDTANTNGRARAIRLPRTDSVINGLTLDGTTSERFSGLFTYSGLGTLENIVFRSGEFQPRTVGSSGGDVGLATIRGFDFTSNRAAVDIVASCSASDWANSSFRSMPIEIINNPKGSDTNHLKSNSDTTRCGVSFCFQEVMFTVLDATNSPRTPVENCKIRVTTTNNSDRRSVTGAGNALNYNNWDFTSTTYDFVDDQTDINGETGTLKVPVYAAIADTSNTGTLNLDFILYSESGVAGSDDFTVYFASYIHGLSSRSIILKSTKIIEQSIDLIVDQTITETDSSVVLAYTSIDDGRELYDRAKIWLYDNFTAQSSTIAARQGADVDIGSYDITIDATASNVFDFDGSAITIKSNAYSGLITTTGSINLLNGATYNLVTTTITAGGLIGAEIRVYALDNNPVGSLGTEIDGVESCPTETFDFTTTANTDVSIQIFKSNFVEFNQVYTTKDSNSVFAANLTFDNNT